MSRRLVSVLVFVFIVVFVYNGSKRDCEFADFHEVGNGVFVRESVVDNLSVVEFVWDGSVINFNDVRPVIFDYLNSRGCSSLASVGIDSGYVVVYVNCSNSFKP